MRRLLPLIVLALVLGTAAYAAPPATLQSLIPSPDHPQELASALKLLIGLSVLSLAPALLIMLTSFTRIIIILSFLRSALGTQQTPPNAILIGLALFLTFFVMSPVYEQVNERALKPYLAGDMKYAQALDRAAVPVRDFLFRQTREKDLGLFITLSKSARPATRDDIPMRALVPAFIISELRTAFQIGFVLFIPFVVLDLIVSSVLMSMGMMMLPPVMISLPIKILLFVMVDGWHLITRSVVLSFG
ncbi:MAG: flagellar type III secretion system pore protein FliP [Armatimonadia bacterium]